VNALLEQFLAESREALQSIGEKLLALEKEPDNGDLLTELFRLVHTLKGNSGLFDLPELTRVLHAGEDLMDTVRGGTVAYSPLLADRLLDAMDFVGMLCDEFEAHGRTDARHIPVAVRLAESLRSLQAVAPGDAGVPESPTMGEVQEAPTDTASPLPLGELPEDIVMIASRQAAAGDPLHWVAYRPDEECFFQGIDPFHQARQTPGMLWGNITPRRAWPKLSELDP
jgi:two-component system, chemotaxis family, sensor kinase CheA